MNDGQEHDSLYIGYLPKVPPATATFVRKAIVLMGRAPESGQKLSENRRGLK